MKENTRDKFIETASNLFGKKGYNATGLNEILAESGAPKGSLYYHFPKGKEQLALEALILAGNKITQSITSHIENIDNPIEAIIYNIENIADIIDKEHKTRDITISLIALETYLSSETLRKACEDLYQSLENIYADKLMKAGMSPEEAHEIGEVICAMMEGAITLSLTRQNGNPLRLIAKQIPNIVKI
ncbi:TetR/AcrR family transcriptional regulator [Anaeromicropila herbilytica]|uniref:TetR family transcriptional regulator n=1 Tax=Anaeromicropila herbilytica TaxID=2785025 RepID=A0A7R7IDQ2_9FIRM|nr:TetR/AcrR family transcriptional regulator [Anaeromicropila herbilytica]BCN31777.1 TetR family transcriptional regulator [Anaeromicropila herbilytica]